MSKKSKFSTVEKIISLFLSFVMVFGVSFIVPIESVGAYTSHSRDEAVAWARSQIGSKIDVDGAYGAQCVDLIKAYYQYLGVSSVLGNGCDYSHNSLPSGWTRIQNTPTFVPEPGDIVVWTDEGWKNGHVAIFLSGDTHSFTSIDQNWPQGSAVKEVSHNYNYVWGVIRPDFNGGNPVNPDPPNPPNPSSDHNPTAVSDAIVGGNGCIGVCGWAFDKDDTSQAIYVHVYIGGNSGDPNAEGHVILANKGRPDVGGAYGCGDFHGYEETITTAKRGNQPVYVYAINIGEGNDNPCFASSSVNIQESQTVPDIPKITTTKTTYQEGSNITINWSETSNTTRYLFEIYYGKVGILSIGSGKPSYTVENVYAGEYTVYVSSRNANGTSERSQGYTFTVNAISPERNVPYQPVRTLFNTGDTSSDPYIAGNDVKWIQQKLKNLGYNVDVDGVYRQTTELAVKQFQSDNSLYVDGICDETTVNMINTCDKVPDIPKITNTQTIYEEESDVTINWNETKYTIYKESNYYFSNENKSGIMVEKKDKVVENGKEQTGTNTRINGIQ